MSLPSFIASQETCHNTSNNQQLELEEKSILNIKEKLLRTQLKKCNAVES